MRVVNNIYHRIISVKYIGVWGRFILGGQFARKSNRNYRFGRKIPKSLFDLGGHPPDCPYAYGHIRTNLTDSNHSCVVFLVCWFKKKKGRYMCKRPLWLLNDHKYSRFRVLYIMLERMFTVLKSVYWSLFVDVIYFMSCNRNYCHIKIRNYVFTISKLMCYGSHSGIRNSSAVSALTKRAEVFRIP